MNSEPGMPSMASPRVSIVVLVFNEAEVLNDTWARLSGVLQETKYRYEFIFVNDGSTDDSEKILTELHCENQASYTVKTRP